MEIAESILPSRFLGFLGVAVQLWRMMRVDVGSTRLDVIIIVLNQSSLVSSQFLTYQPWYLYALYTFDTADTSSPLHNLSSPLDITPPISYHLMIL